MLAIAECLKERQAELKSVARPFKILTDHRNLSYFTSKRLLNERQVRYNDVLQQSNFELKWRSGKSSERPDALFRRQQDKPIGLEDERNAGRLMDLDEGRNIDLATEARLFEDDEIQSLWAKAVEIDEDWIRARNVVRAGERCFPPDIAIKYKANIAEFTVAADGVLRGRENRVWVPDYEPLRTSILQYTHDSHLAGHPGKDTMIGIILRRWFWPKLRESVRRFIRN
ncbi:hypothetical protein K3495_g981 [Podosphaera aphanis]|nr:hypothetical protein K3495_g981 [Podosphaera aphanis]